VTTTPSHAEFISASLAILSLLPHIVILSLQIVMLNLFQHLFLQTADPKRVQGDRAFVMLSLFQHILAKNSRSMKQVQGDNMDKYDGALRPESNRHDR
jgi:hypothetical protein